MALTKVTERIISDNLSISGIATASNFKTGTTNIHSAGVEAAGINVLGGDTPIGTGATVYKDGGARFSGIVTATTYYGSGSNLTGTISTATSAATAYALDSAANITTGIITATSFSGNISGGTVAGSTGNFSSNVTISGNLGVAGTVTYEDVARVDATGISTFREGFKLGPLAGIALTAYKDGSIRTSGIVTASSFVGDGSTLTGLSGVSVANQSNDRIITATGTSDALNGEANLQFDGTDLYVADSIKHLGDPDTLIKFATDTITFDTAGSERLRITSTGAVQSRGASGDAHLCLHRTNAAGSNGNTFGNLYWNDNNSNMVARIRAIRYSAVDDAHLLFETRATGGSVSEKVRITDSGDVAITTRGSTEGVSKLNVEIPARTTAFSASDGDTWHDVLIENPGGATNNAVGLAFQVTSDSYHKNAGTGIAAVKNGTNSDYGADLVFITRGQSVVAEERMRLFYDGDLQFGEGPDNTLWDATNQQGIYYRKTQGSLASATKSNTGYSAYYINKNTGSGTSDTRWVDFYWDSDQRGRISYNGSGGTTFGTSSDYRLKENAVLITDGIAKVKQLKPYRFNFKSEPADKVVQGFFAHEAQEIVPYAATGTKDEVVTQEAFDEGSQPEEKAVGEPIYQDLDYAKFTPILTAALKEAIAKIEVLETKVAALESA